MEGERIRYYCKECGKWLGEIDPDKSVDGLYPYCHRCKKNVEISTDLENCKKVTFKCQSAYK